MLVVLAFALAVPAAAESPLTLTKSDAKGLAKELGQDYLGQMLARPGRKAAVRVNHCRVHGAKGRCAVRVYGTSRCVMRARVKVTQRGELYGWAAKLRCR